MLDFIKAGQNLPYFIVRDIQRWRKAQPSDSTAPPMDFLGLHSPGIKMEGDSPRPIQDLRLNDLIHSTCRKNYNLEKCAGMGLNGFHIK